MISTYRLEHTVSYSEVDSTHKLRLDYIFSHFQNIADLHSREMGTDGESLLRKSNVFWVLTKMKLKVLELPKGGDKLTIETWPLKAKGVRYNRDFSIKNDGKVFVVGSSEWCTLDFTTQKLRKVDSVAYPQEQDMDFRDERSGAGEFIRTKEAVSDKDFHHTYRSAFVDIDTNKHTNNVAYLRMILNCFSPDEFEAIGIYEFQINFLSQTFYDDAVEIYKKRTDAGYYIEGRVNETVVFSCFIHTR